MNKPLAASLLIVPLCAAAALPFTFQSGQTISASEINANFAYLNSRIDALTASSVGSLVTKSGTTSAPPSPSVTVLANTGTTHI